MLKILIGFLTLLTLTQLYGQTCIFQKSNDKWYGSCTGMTAAFIIIPSDSITSGIWRKDITPVSIWRGTMADSGISDSPIEIEIYPARFGVFRTEYGWFSISGFTGTDQEIRFQLDTSKQIPASDLDEDILRLADNILSSDSAWDRHDNRKCEPNAAKVSIYCAMQRAVIQVTGAFHHRRPAMELVRQIIEKRTIGRSYHHRLMDYNNDPSTRLEDVHNIFTEALAHIGK